MSKSVDADWHMYQWRQNGISAIIKANNLDHKTKKKLCLMYYIYSSRRNETDINKIAIIPSDNFICSWLTVAEQ